MKRIAIALIIFYQKTFFIQNALFKTIFLVDQRCKFEPSCSHYTIQAIEKYGVVKGSVKGFVRILSCHPFAKGGYKPVS